MERIREKLSILAEAAKYDVSCSSSGSKIKNYSGYIPVNDHHPILPHIGSQPPRLRENRLYQTDWLLRFYKFDLKELLNEQQPNLDADIDPKLSWALRNLHVFPVDINTAHFNILIRVPGIGRQSAERIVQARKFGKLHTYQLQKIGISFNRAKYFIVCADTPIQLGDKQANVIKAEILSQSQSKYLKISSNQLSLF